MKVGILSTFIGNFGQKGFYNVQEIGLAKELDKLFKEVIIYKLIPKNETPAIEVIPNSNNVTLKLIPSRHIGINGLINLNQLDSKLDALIYFSDTQIAVPQVYKWCKKNNIILIPYVGVTESHSNKKLKRLIINKMFKRNLKVYRKSICLSKTPQVKETLIKHRVNNCQVAPVGLDLSIVNSLYDKTSIESLKEKWGFKPKDKILLFVGRLVPDKEPLELIEIFDQISKSKPSTYKLIIVGSGYLNDSINQLIKEKKLNNNVKVINKIPNNKIWEVYRISDVFINLSKKEIFGMALLEAMYYRCKVVAWDAPGPRYIIKDRVNGFVCQNKQQVIESILLEKEHMTDLANEHVVSNFTWKSSAYVIKDILK